MASSDELMREVADSCPSIFSIEIGNDRIRVPVAWHTAFAIAAVPTNSTSTSRVALRLCSECTFDV